MIEETDWRGSLRTVNGLFKFPIFVVNYLFE